MGQHAVQPGVKSEMQPEKAVGMTRRMAEFIATTDAEKISSVIYMHAKVAFMDWLAVTMGGMGDSTVARLIACEDSLGGAPQATVFGHRMKKNICQAALINGTASHVLDYDDTLVSFFGHPSVTIFPAVLALSEWHGKSGADFLAAYLIGLQSGAVTGVCAGLDHYMAGWHATSTLGHLASAAGCAHLLGLDTEKTVHALGIGATQAAGLKRAFGTMCKSFHAGRAAEAGLKAALLASQGFTSAADMLEGPQGFFALFKGGVNQDVLDLLGLGWDVVNISQKYHASCHATHSPLEAALDVVRVHDIALERIGKIRVFSSQLALDAAGKTSPTSGLEGKFSIPYCVANALLREETGMQAFTDEKVNDPDIRTLMQKIEVVCDSKKTALEATVEVTTTDGRQYEAFSDILQQIPPLEVKMDRVGRKFMDLCVPVLTLEGARKAVETILRLETIPNMQDFITGLFPRG